MYDLWGDPHVDKMEKNLPMENHFVRRNSSEKV